MEAEKPQHLPLQAKTENPSAPLSPGPGRPGNQESLAWKHQCRPGGEDAKWPSPNNEKKKDTFPSLSFVLFGPNRKMATYTEHSKLLEGVPRLKSPPCPFKGPLGACSLSDFHQGSGNLNIHCLGAWEAAVVTPSQEGNNAFHLQAWGGAGRGTR